MKYKKLYTGRTFLLRDARTVDVTHIIPLHALSTLDENANMLYNACMARKLLIVIALFIAAFPHLGFAHSSDMTVTTVLGLFMAAVLLFSKRPKIVKEEQHAPYPESTPSPFVPAMHELPIAHPKEESFQPIIAMPMVTPHIIKGGDAIPSPIGAPIRKRARAVQTDSATVVHHESPVATVPRVRKFAPRVSLSEEAQVQPADVPFSANIKPTEESSSEAHP